MNAYICCMYIPADFRVSDRAVIDDFLERTRFGTLVANGSDGFPLAGHFPFLIFRTETDLIIEIHLAKVNELAVALKNGGPAKLIVVGAHGYVSSSVYTHVNVPTYNYQAVHLRGTAERMSKEELLAHLKATVAGAEAGREKPIDFGSWPPEMIEAYMREIEGFRLVVSQVEAAFKLSQNRNETDFNRIIEDLEKGGCSQRELAVEMKKQRR